MLSCQPGACLSHVQARYQWVKRSRQNYVELLSYQLISCMSHNDRWQYRLPLVYTMSAFCFEITSLYYYNWQFYPWIKAIFSIIIAIIIMYKPPGAYKPPEGWLIDS